MSLPKINFLEVVNSKLKQHQKRWLPVLFLFLALVILSSATYLTLGIITAKKGKSISSLIQAEVLNLLPRFFPYAGFPKVSEKKLNGEEKGRINILLLGIGGEGHEGGSLADTIMLASFYPADAKVALLSIPRDLVIPIPGLGWRKVNNLNAIGELREKGQGGEYFREILGEILDEKIHYYIRVDFSGFEEFIDLLGGIDIEVENDVIDYRYPIKGKEDVWPIADRYQGLKILKGKRHFDGELALKYVRSRYALPPENSDFSRMRRQQKTLRVIKDKLNSLGLKTLQKFFAISDIFAEHVATDFQFWEVYKLWQMTKNISEDDIRLAVLEPGENSSLKAGEGMNGAYIIEPANSDFSEIQGLVDNLFSFGANVAYKQSRVGEGVVLAILNGTKINGLAAKTSSELSDNGFTIKDVGNAHTRDYEKAVIYILKEKTNLEALKLLKERLKANVANQLPEPLKNHTSPDMDFLIVLGSEGS